MTPTLTPDTDVETLVDDVDAGTLRTAERRRAGLERWAKGTAGQDLTLDITDAEGETARVDYGQTPPRITVPGWEIPQPVTDLDRPTYDLLMQQALTLHEIGHLRYTDEDAAAAALERVDPEHRKRFKRFWNALEDGAVEEQLRRDFDVTGELGVMNANYLGKPDGTFGIMDAVLASCIDLGVYDTGTLRGLANPENDEIEFASEADRELFAEEIFDELVETVRSVRTASDAVSRVDAAYEGWNEIEDHIEAADDPTGDQVSLNDGHPHPADGDAGPSSEVDRSSPEELSERLDELVDSLDGMDADSGSDDAKTDADTGGSRSGTDADTGGDGAKDADVADESNAGDNRQPERTDSTGQSASSDGEEGFEASDTADESEGGAPGKGGSEQSGQTPDGAGDSSTETDAGEGQATSDTPGSEEHTADGTEEATDGEEHAPAEEDGAADDGNERVGGGGDEVESGDGDSQTRGGEPEESDPKTGGVSTETADESQQTDRSKPSDGADSGDSGRDQSEQPDDDVTAESGGMESEQPGVEDPTESGGGKADQTADDRADKSDGGNTEESPETDSDRSSTDEGATGGSGDGPTGADTADPREVGGSGEITLPDDDPVDESSSEDESSDDPSPDDGESTEDGSAADDDVWTDDVDSDPDVSPELETEYGSRADQQFEQEERAAQRRTAELEQLQETLNELDDVDVRELQVVDGPDTGRYRSEDASQVRQDSNRLSNILERQLQHEQRSEYRHDRRQGDFDPRVIHRVPLRDFRLFRQEATPDEKDYDAVFVLDRSTSMSGDMSAAERATATLAMALEAIEVDTCLIDMYQDEPRVAKPFGTDVEDELRSILTGDYSGGTPLSPCLKLARNHLRKRSSHPFMIVVTDGRPDNQERYGEILKRANFPVLGVYLDFMASGPHDVPRSVREAGNLFDRRRIITSEEELLSGLQQLCRGVMF